MIYPSLMLMRNGEVDALTDGLLLLRSMFGLTDDVLITGVVSADASVTDSTAIDSYISSIKGTTYGQLTSGIGPAGPQGEKGEKAIRADGMGNRAKGDKGDAGAQGIQGVTGSAGATGAQGDKGDKGDKGDMGATGAAGSGGATGPQGATGATGASGTGLNIKEHGCNRHQVHYGFYGTGPTGTTSAMWI